MKNFILIFISSFFLILATLFVLFYLSSSGKVKQYRDNSGEKISLSISEKTFVNVNGYRQGMFIKGFDKTKPVLLFLHGGPGMPEYAISRKYKQILEKHFVVCWWEQPGAGLSYSKTITGNNITFERLKSDAVEVTKYLIKRFNKRKIYLLAHSGGTFIGIQIAKENPELFEAYLAISQITYQQKSEELAYDYMLEQYKKKNDDRMLSKLKKFSKNELNTPEYYRMRDIPMHKLGIGTTHNMHSIFSGIFLPVMMNNEYTMKEKINIWKGKFYSTNKCKLWDKLTKVDLTKKVDSLEVPVYFFEGIYDYTCSTKLAKDYFNIIKAPKKSFYTFYHSAHSPLFEEPDKFENILNKDILK